MILKEKYISILVAISMMILFAIGFVALRIGIAISFTLVENIISDSVLDKLFLVLQGIAAGALVAYFFIKKQFALVMAAILGFIFSFGFGPMD